MNYSLYSHQLVPYLRFAGLRKRAEDLAHFAMARDCRLFYFVSGTGTLLIEDEVYEAAAGDLFLVPPMTAYSLRDAQDCSFYLLNFDYHSDGSNPEKPLPVTVDRAMQPVQRVHLMDFPQLDQAARLHIAGLEPQLSKMAALYAEKEMYYHLSINAQFSLLLITVFRFMQSSSARSSISDITAYINQHYAEDLTNITLGKIFNYHPHYINALFKRYTGKTLHQYLLQCRIEAAITLLTTTSLSVSEIAAKTGWHYASHFSDAFKKATGYSPNHYRIGV